MKHKKLPGKEYSKLKFFHPSFSARKLKFHPFFFYFAATLRTTITINNRKFLHLVSRIWKSLEAYRSKLEKILPVDGQCFYLSVTSAYARETYKSVGLIGFYESGQRVRGNKNAFEERNASIGQNRNIRRDRSDE